nr:hypothetical protein [Tanacetum cinerariifolium]
MRKKGYPSRIRRGSYISACYNVIAVVSGVWSRRTGRKTKDDSLEHTSLAFSVFDGRKRRALHWPKRAGLTVAAVWCSRHWWCGC